MSAAAAAQLLDQEDNSLTAATPPPPPPPPAPPPPLDSSDGPAPAPLHHQPSHLTWLANAKLEGQARDDDSQHKQASSEQRRDPSLLNLKELPRTGKRGAPQAFPHLLFLMLERESKDVIHWTQEGRAFVPSRSVRFLPSHILIGHSLLADLCR